MSTIRSIPLILILVAAPRGVALEIRGLGPEDPSPFTRLFGVPFSPVENGGFAHGVDRFRAIVWPDFDPAVATEDQQWHRQMAMVSPVHFISARHYPIPVGWPMAWMKPNGSVGLRTISGFQDVLNSSGEVTDLTLGSLSSALDERGFRVLTMPTQGDYQGKPLLVFGKVSRAGTATLGGFGSLSDPGFDHTVFARFDYQNNGTDPADCKFESGDSGSPVFVLESGDPLLIGCSADVIEQPGHAENYVSFIPSYLDEIDALMAPAGFCLRRYPVENASVTAAAPVAVSTLLTGRAGSATLEVANAGPGIARNPELRITCVSPPTSVSGNGWVTVREGSDVWSCHRATADSGTTSVLTLAWTSIPAGTSMTVISALTHDAGLDPLTRSDNLTITPDDYGAWAAGLADPGLKADPDHDGIANLIEYATGGSGGVPGPTPVTMLAGQSGFSFLRRTDAVARGLVYQVQFSADLTAWAVSLPPGVSMATTSGPPGYDKVSVSIPTPGGFYRLRVVITP